MILVLCSRADVPSMIEAHDPEVILSAVGRGDPLPPLSDRRAVVHLAFNDVQRDSGPWRAPTARHVDRMFAAVDGWSGSRPMLVHCHEGRSRAPAVALGVMCRLGIDPRAAVDNLMRAVPWCTPHQGFVLLVDTALQRGGRLVGVMSKAHSSMHSTKNVGGRTVAVLNLSDRIQGR